MLQQLRGFKFLTMVFARGQKATVREIEQRLEKLVEVIDGFYDLLGSRHWIFHDSMNMDVAKLIIAKPADEAEDALIAYYQDPAALGFMISRLGVHPEMRPRMVLVERAQEDYESERFYSTVLVLLAVMDGFVNDIDSERRRGLHARSEEEMTPWDSAAGHHLGLGRAHRTFTKTFGKTSDEEVHELYRNGIVHGMLTNFDNRIVATKAWNRLFAVTDWAAGHEKKTAPTEPKPSWADVLKQVAENDKTKKAIAGWRPRTLTEPTDFTNEPLYAIACGFLNAWKARNYGEMAACLAWLTRGDTQRKTAGLVRDHYSHVELEDFRITKLDFQGPVICEIEADLVWNGNAKAGRLRWIREDDQGEPAVLDHPRGEWRLMSWGPHAMVDRPGET
jgi:hypothetical protein